MMIEKMSRQNPRYEILLKGKKMRSCELQGSAFLAWGTRDVGSCGFAHGLAACLLPRGEVSVLLHFLSLSHCSKWRGGHG